MITLSKGFKTQDTEALETQSQPPEAPKAHLGSRMVGYVLNAVDKFGAFFVQCAVPPEDTRTSEHFVGQEFDDSQRDWYLAATESPSLEASIGKPVLLQKGDNGLTIDTSQNPNNPRISAEQRAYDVFQIAQAHRP